MKKGQWRNYFMMTVISVYLLAPLLATLVYSLFREWSDVLPTGFTLDAYLQIFSDPAFLLAICRTLLISILPIAICVIVILCAMYVVVVYHPKLNRYLQILCTIPYAIQGVILAISLLSLYASLPEPLSNRVLLLTAAYCITILPYMYQGIHNALLGVNAVKLLEAAQMLGASKFYAFFRIIVPNVLSGITISALLAAAIIFGDFVVINILSGNYFPTAQMYLYDVLKKSGPRSSAVIIVLFTVTLLMSVLVYRLQCKKKEEV